MKVKEYTKEYIKEDIIEAEFSVVDDEPNADSAREANLWVLVGNNLADAKLAKIFIRVRVYSGFVECYVSQIEGIDVKNAFDFVISENFDEIPTKEAQREMAKRALLKHELTGEIWQVGERYANGHLSALQIQRRIRGGAKC